MRKRILFIVLFAWSGILHAFSQQQANYELANEFQAFGLGGNFTANSLNLWPNEINGTDKFWFEFHTTVGKDYYFVDVSSYKVKLDGQEINIVNKNLNGQILTAEVTYKDGSVEMLSTTIRK